MTQVANFPVMEIATIKAEDKAKEAKNAITE
jgi:hypothetical protein